MFSKLFTIGGKTAIWLSKLHPNDKRFLAICGKAFLGMSFIYSIANTPFIKPAIISYCNNRKLNDGQINGIAYLYYHIHDEKKANNHLDKLIYYEKNREWAIIPSKPPITEDINKMFRTCVCSTNQTTIDKFIEYAKCRGAELCDIRVDFDTISLLLRNKGVRGFELVKFIYENMKINPMDKRDANWNISSILSDDKMTDEILEYLVIHDPSFVKSIMSGYVSHSIKIKHAHTFAKHNLLQYFKYFDCNEILDTLLHNHKNIDNLTNLFKQLTQKQKFNIMCSIFSDICYKKCKFNYEATKIFWNEVQTIDQNIKTSSGENLAYVYWFYVYKAHMDNPNHPTNSLHGLELKFPYYAGMDNDGRTPWQNVIYLDEQSKKTSSYWCDSNYADDSYYGGGCSSYGCSSSTPSSCFLI